MKAEDRFYVYVHKYKTGEKEGEVFYVGKGTGTRIHSNSSRNLHWHNINKKYGRVCEIKKGGMITEDACDYEINLIKEIGMENLCNLSEGGDSGALGLKHSEEHKKKMSEFMKINTRERMSKYGYVHPCTGNIASDSKKEKLSNKTKEFWSNPDNKALMIKNIKKSLSNPETIKKMKDKNLGKNNPNYGGQLRLLIHKDGSVFSGTQHDIYTILNLNKGNLSQMFLGKRKTVSGWRIKNDFS